MTTTTLPPSRPRIDLSDDTPVDLNKPVQKDVINIAADTLADNTAWMDERPRMLVRWLYSYARENHLGWNQLSELSRISTTVLYRVFHDKYRYPDFDGKDTTGQPKPHKNAGQRIGLDSICDTIERCKALVTERAEATRRFFVETTVSKRIWKVADEVRLMETVGFIYGESQIGKSFALEEYTHAHNSGQTIYVRLPASAGVQEMLKSIAAACPGTPTKLPFNKLKAKLLRYLDHTRLLIIDEAHLIFETYQKSSALRCLETLRELHDATRCGLLICATEIFREELESGEYAKMLTQLKRRGTYVLNLGTQAPRRDWLALAAAHQLPAPADYAEMLVKEIIAKDGLGKFCLFLRKAANMAGKKKEKLTWQHFTRCHELISKMAVAPKADEGEERE